MEEENLSGKEKKKVFGIFKKKEIWISGVIGLVLGAALICVLSILGIFGLNIDKPIASFKGGKVTENELYNKIKGYGFNYVLELADEEILDAKYELTEEQKQEVEQEVEKVLEEYNEYYGYTEETFLKENGFESKEEFIKYMELNHRRNLYCIDYFKTLIPTENIENYYNENVNMGEIKTEHILVEVSDKVDKEEALSIANEIIEKLNKGNKFEDVAIQYRDEGKAIYQDVEIDSFNAESYIKSYVEASKKLEKDTYTKKAVKTDYGYHVIYCVNKEDKPSLEQATNDIVEVLAQDLEVEDQYIRYKALIKLREDYKLKFADEKFEEEYKEYCEQINGTVEE